MGTFCEIEIIDKNENRSKEIIELAFSEMRRVESLLSKYDERSEISRINVGAAHAPVTTTGEVIGLILESVRCSRITHGAFDITVSPLVDLWQEAGRKNLVPSEEEVLRARKLVGPGNILIDHAGETVFFRKKGVQLDLGGIGKGYAIDRVVQILRRNNVDQAMINAGGQCYVLGNFFDREFSTVGIVNPLDPEQIIATVELRDQSIATSANYERPLIIEGASYGHIINPVTGYPEQKVLGVSIVAQTAIEADMFSTPVFLMSEKEGMKFITNHQGIEGVVITANSGKLRVDVSEGLREKTEMSLVEVPATPPMAGIAS